MNECIIEGVCFCQEQQHCTYYLLSILMSTALPNLLLFMEFTSP